MRTYHERITPRAAGVAYWPAQVAAAYHYPDPDVYSGRGFKSGIIELGGGYTNADIAAYFAAQGRKAPKVTSVEVAGGSNAPDGPNGADGEVLLDIEVCASLAPGAEHCVYFAPNTDGGFLAAIERAVDDGCSVISISWGQAESQWSTASLTAFNNAFARARAAGVIVCCASGDTGADDSTPHPVTDFPASSPHVIACGGTRLELTPAGERASEVAWDDNDRTSATGGGTSVVFAGRQVPDIAANADPQTGYKILVDGEWAVIGGTSAVAPLTAGLVLQLSEAVGAPLGSRADFMNLLLTNLGVMFDVTAGDNGAYRAGPGRDLVTGLGVIDGGRLLKVLTSDAPVPPPIGTPAPLPPSYTPVPFTSDELATLDLWAGKPWSANKPRAAYKAGRARGATQ